MQNIFFFLNVFLIEMLFFFCLSTPVLVGIICAAVAVVLIAAAVMVYFLVFKAVSVYILSIQNMHTFVRIHTSDTCVYFLLR